MVTVDDRLDHDIVDSLLVTCWDQKLRLRSFCNRGIETTRLSSGLLEVCWDTALPMLTEKVVLYLLIVLDRHRDC